ncbi:MAG: 2-dehydropantoate 2-reductase [Janthinobacterium lividum]
MKLTVVGAGAVGGLLAAALVRGGQPVNLLARGATLAAVREHGLRVRDPATQEADRPSEWRVDVDAASDARRFGVQDCIVIALKAQQLAGAVADIAPLCGPTTVVISASNGLPWWFLHCLDGPLAGQSIASVDPDGALCRRFPPPRAAGCVVHLSVSVAAPGVIARGNGNRLIVGAADPTERSVAACLDAVSAAWSRGGMAVSSTARIRDDIWAKLWGNMTMNPLSALTRATADRLLDDPYTAELIRQMMREATALGVRLGLTLRTDEQAIEERIAVTRQLGAFKTSMLQDLEASRPLELAPLLGVFPELGRRLGVDTPYCDAVLGLARLLDDKLQEAAPGAA